MTKRTKPSGLLPPVVLVLVAIALWIGWWIFVSVHFRPSEDRSLDKIMALRGQFGDMFGGVNALFTALVLAGAVYAVWLQHKELERYARQHEEAVRANARTALLAAYAALVNARTASVDLRYRMGQDLAPLLAKQDLDATARTQFQMMLSSNLTKMSDEWNALDLVTKELEAIISEVRPEATSEGASPTSQSSAEAAQQQAGAARRDAGRSA